MKKAYEYSHSEVVSEAEEAELVTDSKRTRKDKIVEKFTPLLALTFIVTPVILAIFAHEAAAIYILVVVVYFVYKSVSMAFFFGLGLRRLRKANQIDWKKKLDNLENISETIKRHQNAILQIQTLTYNEFDAYDEKVFTELLQINKYLAATGRLPEFMRKFLFNREKRKAIGFLKKEIEELKRFSGRDLFPQEELRHVVLIPHVKEPVSLLRETVRRLANQSFNTKQITIILASEAADPNGIATSETIKAEFEDTFENIWITKHEPQEYDIVGKSSNMNWAGRVAHKRILELGWDLEKTTLTSCDADSKFEPDYFSMLSYYYITHPKAKYKLFSGAMVFYNNIWRVHFFARIQNSLYTITNVALLSRPDKYIYVSTYSMSFWLMKEIDFWTPYLVPEDYHIFFKCLYKYDKEVSAIPMPIKILSDAAEGDNFWDSFKNNYKQFRRWSWGVSDHGWMLKNLFNNFWSRSIRSKYMTLHTIFDWTIGQGAAIIVLIGGSLPFLVSPINPDFQNDPAGALLPGIVDTLLRITIASLIVIIFLNFYLRPIPKEMPWWRKPFAIIEWATFPITGFILATVPTFDAQTKLIFEQYLEHIVTIKKGAKGELSKAHANERSS